LLLAGLVLGLMGRGRRGIGRRRRCLRERDRAAQHQHPKRNRYEFQHLRHCPPWVRLKADTTYDKVLELYGPRPSRTNKESVVMKRIAGVCLGCVLMATVADAQ